MTIQGLLVMAIAALAASLLAWRVVGPFLRGSVSAGCHGCSTPCELKAISRQQPCNQAETPAPLNLVKSPAADQPR